MLKPLADRVLIRLEAKKKKLKVVFSFLIQQKKNLKKA